MIDSFRLEYQRMWQPRQSGQGALIVLCGFDGSGKTTQIAELVARLRRERRPVVETRQPTDWYRSDPWVRRFLDTGECSNMHALALFAAADRRRHVSETVCPSLKNNRIVLSDRYVFSSLAYFGARGLEMSTVAKLNATIPRPDLAVYLDLAPTSLQDRIKSRDGKLLKYEEQRLALVRTTRENYLRIGAVDPNFHIIDGEQSAESIANSIWKLASEIIGDGLLPENAASQIDQT